MTEAMGSIASVALREADLDPLGANSLKVLSRGSRTGAVFLTACAFAAAAFGFAAPEVFWRITFSRPQAAQWRG